MLPSISLVVPLFNKRDFVLQAVQSALEQALQPLEVIVVDDGSTDGSAESLGSCGDSRLTLLRQPNAGVAAARNAGVRVARGDVVCFLDADDLLLPDHLLCIASLARDHPQAMMFGTAFHRLTPDGRKLPPRRAALPPRGLVADFFGAWSRGPFTYTSAIGVRRSALASIAFPVGERWGEDQDVWFRLAEAGPVAYDPRPTVLYRVGLQESATGTEGRRVEPLPAYVRLARRLEGGEIPRPLRAGVTRLIAQHHLNIAEARLSAGDVAGAGALIAKGPASTQFRRYATLQLRMLAMRCRTGDRPV